MKTVKIASPVMTLLLGFLFLSLSFTGCSKEDNASTPADDSQIKSALTDYSYNDTVPYANCCLDTIPSGTLSPAEEEALIYLREEEYLAHDVYLALSQLYTKPIFSNIKKSELRHTTAVKTLINRYNLVDPAANHVTGNFTNPELQSIYSALVAQGSVSLLDGLIVGATIEDLDIADLKSKLLVVNNSDIILVVNNLMRGSRNHLRSFYANIVFMGGTYTPQYLSQEEFNAIVNSKHEIGPGN